MSLNKVLLVSPPMDDDYLSVGVNDSPILGLLSLENYARRYFNSHVEIKIIAGECHHITDTINVIKHNKYDIVGLQPMMASYKNTLYISEVAKNMGSRVVFGGHHATQ